MIGSNTTEIAASSYAAGYKTGVDHVLTDLNELMFSTEKFESHEERLAVQKAYFILCKMYPEAETE